VQSPLANLLDASERSGKLNLRTADIAQALPGISADALRQALRRQQRKGRIARTSRGSTHWVIVPLQDAASGAPPLETWLDMYLSKTLGVPYYVSLLSAAEAYGASPQAVMVTQVMTSQARRPVQVGRHRLVFFKSARIAALPTRWHATPHGRFRVSTPELTALDLVARQQAAGGIARVIEVLQSLATQMTADGLTLALNAALETPTAQRLGAILVQQGQPTLANQVSAWLDTRRTRRIPLTPHSDAHSDEHNASTRGSPFKVNMPDTLEPANT